MEASTYHDLWLNLATNSPFLAFLLYNWWTQNKQNEAYRLEIKRDRDQYEQKREKSIEEIRNRYSSVIEQLRNEKEEYRKEMDRIREKCENEKHQILGSLQKKLDMIDLKMEK